MSTNCSLVLQVEVDNAHGIHQIFDDISYSKGSAVIRMLQGYLGDDIIQVWKLTLQFTE